MATQRFISAATDLFSAIDSRAMFITIHDYKNNFGEIATHSLCWHIHYLRAVDISYEIMLKFKPTAKFCVGRPFAIMDLKAARQEWMESLADSLVLGEGSNHRATSIHAYDRIIDAKGRIIPGVKIHRNDDVLHLTNVYRLAKVVHKTGSYPNRMSARKTLAKRALRNMTPLKRWGQFVLAPGRFKKMTVNKITVKEEDTIRNWNN